MEAVNRPLQPPAAVDGNDSKFRRLLDVLPAAAYTCDVDGLITYYNQHAVELWGREPRLNDASDRFCGSFRLFSSDGVLIHHDECWMALAMRENREFHGCEIVIERPDGERRTVLAHASPFRDAVGDPIGAVNILVDITERKRAEEALLEADHRKDEFLATLAHELRNPLAPIRSALHLLRPGMDDGVTLEETRAMMERQVVQIVRLVDDLMDVSRITNNKMVLHKTRVELATVIQSAVEATRPFIVQFGHELSIALPSESMPLHADSGRLAQVFSNLLNNAAKYMAPGGRIWVSAQEEGGDVVVVVRDAGIGIPADILPRIFDLFTQAEVSLTRSRGGLGIGLNLARSQVQMHGGSIEAHSDGAGHGSKFIVRLPLAVGPKTAVAQPQSDRQKPAASGTRRVLVVDDNEDAASSLALILQHMGNHTRTAYDGAEAVQAADEFRPDVMLLDIGLPTMDGHAVARKLREQPWGRSILLVAVTGWGQDQDRRQSEEAGFDLHMVKPLDIASLEKLMAGPLREPART